MSFWLCITTDYEAAHAHVCKENNIVATLSTTKNDCNKYLITLIAQLLDNHHLSLQQLLYIGINLGPGPYTSLRIAITTANGLARALHIPLVGIDALKTFVRNNTVAHTTTVALLNAFNQDVFYGISTKTNDIITGYNNINLLLQDMSINANQPLYFIGNGVTLYNDTLLQLNGVTYELNHTLEYPSVHTLVEACWQNWLTKELVASEQLPLYLKKLQYHNSIHVK